MSHGDTAADTAALTTAVRTVAGVRAATVLGGGDRPWQILAITAADVSADEMARLLCEAADRQVGITINPEAVSVVQVRGDDPALTGGLEPALLAPAATRPALTNVAVTEQDRTCSVTVTVAVEGGGGYDGTATGPAADGVTEAIVAEATLDAVAPLLGVPAAVEGIGLAQLAVHEVALCVVTLQTEYGPLALSGSAVVRFGVYDAVARSVLAAVNRRLTG